MAGAEDETRAAGADGARPPDRSGCPPSDAKLPGDGGAGLSWSWGLDLPALIDAMTGAAPWLRDPADGSDLLYPSGQDAPAGQPPADQPGPDPEADEQEYQEAVAAGRVRDVPLHAVAGRVAEALPPGPDLAGWLAQAGAADLEDGALAGVAASFRRLASWAAAGELAVVAQIASRSARADRRATVDPHGRPDRVTADAAGQISLALAMSHDGACAWADLGVVLAWRLPATGVALAEGRIDLGRARMIVRMTAPLRDVAPERLKPRCSGAPDG